MSSTYSAFTCSKLIMETQKQSLKYVVKVNKHWNDVNDFIVKFEQISHIILVFPLLTLNK